VDQYNKSKGDSNELWVDSGLRFTGYSSVTIDGKAFPGIHVTKEKERDQLKNAQLIIDTQAAEIRRLHALLGTVPVDEGPRIERLEQALREQVATAKHHEEESLTRLEIINRVRKLADTWANNGLGRFASEVRKELRNG
jgi:hypothetical protein